MKTLPILFLLFSIHGFSQSDSVKTIIVEKPKANSCYTVTGADTVFDQKCIATAPSFSTGSTAMYEYIGQRIKYPYQARELGIQGKVYVKFVIYADGSVHDVTLLKGVHVTAQDSTRQDDYDDAAKLMNDGAMEVIAGMPNWSPGYQNGKAVRVSYVVPINFKLK